MTTAAAEIIAYVLLALGLVSVAAWKKDVFLYVAASIGLILIGYHLWDTVSYAMGVPVFLMSGYTLIRFVLWFIK